MGEEVLEPLSLVQGDFEHPLQRHPLTAAGRPVDWPTDRKHVTVHDDSARGDEPVSPPPPPLLFGGEDPVERRHRGAGDLVVVDRPSPLGFRRLGGDASGSAPTADAVAGDFLPAANDPLLAPPPPPKAAVEEVGLYDVPFETRTTPARSSTRGPSALRQDVTVAYDSESGDRNSAGSFIIRSSATRRRVLLGMDSATAAAGTPNNSGDTAELEVRRTIADFVWLDERLRARYDSLIIPTLPPMNLAGRLKYGFAYLDARRRGLERFLRRIASHVELAGCEEVTAFLG